MVRPRRFVLLLSAFLPLAAWAQDAQVAFGGLRQDTTLPNETGIVVASSTFDWCSKKMSPRKLAAIGGENHCKRVKLPLRCAHTVNARLRDMLNF